MIGDRSPVHATRDDPIPGVVTDLFDKASIIRQPERRNAVVVRKPGLLHTAPVSSSGRHAP